MKALHLMVVDDDPDWIHWLKFYLFRTFAPPQYLLEINTARHGSEALVLLNRASAGGKLPDLVLSDTNMPNMDGLEFWNSFLKEYQKNIPFILLFSGWRENPNLTKDDLHALGIEYILAKEDVESQLGLVISKILRE